MDYSPFPNGHPQWLQTQLQDQPHNQDERSPQQRNEGAGEVMLGASEDVSATTSNISPTVHPHTFYTIPPYQFSPYNNFQMPPYGQQQPQQPQWSVPLSSYSSLNGATSGQGSTQPQRSPVQQVQSPLLPQHTPPPPQPQQYQPSQSSQQPSQITIDPSLMLANYNQQAAHSSTAFPPTAYYSYPSHTPPLSLNPSLLHTTPHAALTQNQQLNGPVAGPSNPSKSSLASILNNLLSSKGLPNTPAQIVRTIISMGPSEVELPMRLQVLSKIRDYAGNDFYQAWASDLEAMDIIRDWLKGAVTSKTGDWDETVMPLLHVIDRLPLTLESLKNAKIGKVILKLKESSSSSAVKDMASNLENRWRSLVNSTDGKSPAEGGVKKSEGKGIEDQRPKKRKLDEPQSKVIPPIKRLAMSRTVAPLTKPVPVVKKEFKPITAVKDAKSDSSFFSAPKPKPKLPSFKKAPLSKKDSPTDQNIAQPSAVDPFKDALAAMTKARSSPTPTEVTPTPLIVSTGPPGRKKKKVSFASEEKLVQIKLIEPAVYDDDATEGVYHSHNIRDLDRDEGAAMHKHLFEEQIDWMEPPALDIPPPLDALRGEHSHEKLVQEEREKSALNALYMSPSQIPDSPAEPTNQIPEDEVDTNVKVMLSGNEVRELDRGDRDPAISVQGLISQLAGVGGSVTGDHVDVAAVSQPAPAVDLKQLGFDLSLFAQLAAQQQPPQGSAPMLNGYGYSQPQPQPQPSSHMDEQVWNNQYHDYGQAGYEENGNQRSKNWDGHSDQGRGRGRGAGKGGGRGGFRNNKRKLCNFYANGRCRYGDQCDFLHEL